MEDGWAQRYTLDSEHAAQHDGCIEESLQANIPRSAKPYGATQLVRLCDKALAPLSSMAKGLALAKQALLPAGGWMLWPAHEAGQEALTTNTRLFQG